MTNMKDILNDFAHDIIKMIEKRSSDEDEFLTLEEEIEIIIEEYLGQ